MQVPMGATVFCQPLQMRFDSVNDLDVSSVNRWRWRPDYEGLQLADCRCTPDALSLSCYMQDRLCSCVS